MLTGLYAQRTGHSGKHWNQPTDYSVSITLGEALQLGGYHTMMVGKWQDPDFPTTRGFDRFFGPMCSGKISYFDEVGWNPFYIDDQHFPLPEDFYLTDALTDHALQFLEEAMMKSASAEIPFFLYVAHVAPHWPLHAREFEIAPHRSRYLHKGWEDWSNFRYQRQKELGIIPDNWIACPLPPEIHDWHNDPFKEWQAELMAVYSAQVASVDESVGKIVDLLERKGRLENTLIIFLSDNGAAHDGSLVPVDRMLGFAPGSSVNTSWRKDGGTTKPGSGPDNMPGSADTFAAYGLAWALTSNAPLRSTKLTGYEGGIRTPLIVHWPKAIRAKGELVHSVGHIIDFMPTFLELAEVAYPERFNGRHPHPLDGQSLVPLLLNGKRMEHSALFWRVPQHRVLRSGKWKIISGDQDSPWELFNLEEDGAETTNLASRHPSLVKQLSSQWEQWIKSCSTVTVGEGVE